MSSVFDQPFLNNSGCFCVQPDMDTSNFGSQNQPGINKGGTLTMEDKKKKSEVDALLAAAMNNLTFEEREKQQEALHGVDDDFVEDSKVVEDALVELEQVILGIKRGSVYETAEMMNPSYVNARDFRIMFLRGNRFDVMDAARQMIKFFEMKLILFGMDKLTDDITIRDLDQDDLACMRTGWHQFSGKDRPGRTVVLQLLGLRAKTVRNELRMKFFMLMDLLKDEEVQRRGVVYLIYAVDDFKDKSGVGYMEHTELSNSIPLYHCATHFCCDEIRQYLVCKLAIGMAPQKFRSRIRMHIGSGLECLYQLSTYGISSANLPLIAGTNMIDMKRHIDYCQSREIMSNGGAMNGLSVKEPTSNDVLYMGGTRSYNDGNNRLRELVVEWSETYGNGTNEAKRRVVDEIIDNVHRSGGRFLTIPKGSSTWSEVPRDDVRLKITQAFRNLRRKAARSSKRKQK